MKVSANITVTELINLLQSYQKEIGCDGTKIGSHDIKSQVVFAVSNPEIDNLELELDSIELNLLPGCACPDGVWFWLKVTEETANAA